MYISAEDHPGAGAEELREMDEIWNAHVQQLISCDLCSRTFFPDRSLGGCL